jgi:hypothetical protein
MEARKRVVESRASRVVCGQVRRGQVTMLIQTCTRGTGNGQEQSGVNNTRMGGRCNCSNAIVIAGILFLLKPCHCDDKRSRSSSLVKEERRRRVVVIVVVMTVEAMGISFIATRVAAVNAGQKQVQVPVQVKIAGAGAGSGSGECQMWLRPYYCP